MKLLRIAVLELSLSLIPTLAMCDDWNQFRGPRGNSIVDSAKLPTEWSEERNIQWKVAIPGRGWSQPVVAGNKVFVATAISQQEEKPRRFEGGIVRDALDSRKHDYQWQLICLSADTGKKLWLDTPFEGKPKMPKHRSNTYASETPVTDGERIIVHFGMQGVVCYDLEGKRQWTVDLGQFQTQAGWGTGSSPIIHGENVIIQCDNNDSSFLIAMDKKTGEKRWRVDRDEPSNWSTPYIWKNKLRTELVVAGGRKNRSYDPVDGRLLWEMSGSGRTSVSPVGDDEMIYVDSVDWLMGSPGRFAAIRPGASGDISLPDAKNSSEFVAWSVMVKAYRNSSPLLFGNRLYLLEQNGGIVRCFDAKSGALQYQQRLPESAGFAASPWANDGKIFLMDETGLTVVAEQADQLKILTSNRLNDDLFWASPAVAADRLILRGMNHLYCISRATKF